MLPGRARDPRLIGYSFIDPAFTGRWFQGFIGERANTGVLAVTDRPWKAMLAEVAKTNHDIYRVWFGERPPSVPVKSPFQK